MPTCPPSCPLSCPRTGGGAKYGFEAMSELLRLPVRHGQGDTERRTWVAARAKGGDGRLEQNERLRDTLEVSAAEALSREDLEASLSRTLCGPRRTHWPSRPITTTLNVVLSACRALATRPGTLWARPRRLQVPVVGSSRLDDAASSLTPRTERTRWCQQSRSRCC